MQMELANNIISVLKEAADPTIAISMQKYMRDQFEYFGVPSPVRKSSCKDLLLSSSKIDKDILLDQMDILWNVDFRECQYVAIDILIRNKNRLRSEDLQRVLHWVTTKSWWDTVDALASNIVGVLFEKDKVLMRASTEKWIECNNIWLNRVCLIFQLKYGHKTDFELLKKFILLLNHKNDFFIQKAIGWSIRQYSKFKPDEVRDFINITPLSNLAHKEGMKHINR